MIWACDAKRGPLCRKTDEWNVSTRTKEAVQAKLVEPCEGWYQRERTAGGGTLRPNHLAAWRHTPTPHTSETKTKGKKTSHIVCGDSQDVGGDADAPQIGGRRDRFVGRHFGWRKLGRAVLDVKRARRAVAARAPEVDHLELIGRETQKEQVLRLQEKTRYGQH